jgi:hypothetical protein
VHHLSTDSRDRRTAGAAGGRPHQLGRGSRARPGAGRAGMARARGRALPAPAPRRRLALGGRRGGAGARQRAWLPPTAALPVCGPSHADVPLPRAFRRPPSPKFSCLVSVSYGISVQGIYACQMGCTSPLCCCGGYRPGRPKAGAELWTLVCPSRSSNSQSGLPSTPFASCGLTWTICTHLKAHPMLSGRQATPGQQATPVLICTGHKSDSSCKRHAARPHSSSAPPPADRLGPTLLCPATHLPAYLTSLAHIMHSVQSGPPQPHGHLAVYLPYPRRAAGCGSA